MTKQIKITTIKKTYKFVGAYRRDLEKKNWHYYETKNGKIIHFRKEYIISVEE